MIMGNASFLAPQLAVLLGRHARKSGFIQRLAEAATYNLSNARYTGASGQQRGVTAPRLIARHFIAALRHNDRLG